MVATADHAGAPIELGMRQYLRGLGFALMIHDRRAFRWFFTEKRVGGKQLFRKFIIYETILP
jgi:hypothetical protein